VNASSATSPNQHALRRARQAVRCLPFRLSFYQELEQGALSSTQLAGRSDWQSLSRRRLSANRTEDHLIWLIQLGVLRREVDGQGLTERVRLTPLGRQVLSQWDGEISRASIPRRMLHWLVQHWPRL
jgi:hypothetical protein